jgi:hypothetical protein
LDRRRADDDADMSTTLSTHSVSVSRLQVMFGGRGVVAQCLLLGASGRHILVLRFAAKEPGANVGYLLACFQESGAEAGQGQQVANYLRASLIIFSMVSSMFLT